MGMGISQRLDLESVETNERKLASDFRKKQKEIHKKKLFLVRGSRIKCVHCGKQPSLRKFQFIQNEWYESPWSCNGGGNWHSSETKLCHIICPSCNKENYINNHPDVIKIVSLIGDYGLEKKEIFAVIWEKCGDHPRRQTFPEEERDYSDW